MDLTGARWRTSSYSGNDGGNCVQVATNLPGLIAARDSKDPHGPAVTVSPQQWRSFVTAVKARSTDLS